jgi:heterodisulfide reductase subunit A
VALIDAGCVEQEPNTACVGEEDCSGCRPRVPRCPYGAILSREGAGKAEVSPALSKGCGTCVSACPTGSMQRHLFEDEEILGEIEGVLADV